MITLCLTRNAAQVNGAPSILCAFQATESVLKKKYLKKYFSKLYLCFKILVYSS